jgi:hypothetical protein
MGNRPEDIIWKVEEEEEEEEEYDYDLYESYYDCYDCGVHLKAYFLIS